METFLLKNQFQGSCTSVENIFIDRYMAHANGEFVKVYLYLLRHLTAEDLPLCLADIADAFEDTERDILRAIRYWAEQGLLSLEEDADGTLRSVTIRSRISAPVIADETPKTWERPDTAIGTADTAAADMGAADPAMQTADNDAHGAHADAPTPICAFKSRRELKQVLFVTEQYFGRTLTRSETETIVYCYEELGFSCDLLEHLIEYCVGKGHTSIHYIRQVALNWADKGIRTVQEAKEEASSHNKDFYRILQAMGIQNRAPGTIETEFMTRWSSTLGFSLEMIIEACRRTIGQIHQPSFDYADRILENWHKNGLHTPEAVVAADEAFKSERAKTAPRRKKNAKKTSPALPQPRAYDYDALEEQLLKSN